MLVIIFIGNKIFSFTREKNEMRNLSGEGKTVAKFGVALIKAKTSVWLLMGHSYFESALYIYYYSYFVQQLSVVGFIIIPILQMRRQAEEN